nr:hypothetical protein [Candidatus Sigynarchaeota archaeon]
MIRSMLAHRYRHVSRVFLEIVAKLASVGGFAFILILHFYTSTLLALAGVIPELVLPTVLFDILLGAGGFCLVLITGTGKHGPVVEWLSFLVIDVICISIWIGMIEIIEPFQSGMLFFPAASVMLIAWLLLFGVSAVYVIGVGIGALVKLFGKNINISRRPKKQRMMTVLVTILPALLLALAQPVTSRVFDKTVISRTITIIDTNTNCSLAMWDLPPWNAQNGTSRDIDLALLTTEQQRAMTAFKAMSTTFFGQLYISTAEEQNITIAKLKMLAAYNLSVCWTIWYQNHSGFPGSAYPEDWIGSARSTLEFILVNNITNVVGICMDSESSPDLAPDEYWYNVGLYNDFLTEVKTNTSLRNPNPRMETFETVLCTGEKALEDCIDGDQDNYVRGRYLGLPPSSWSSYHFMMYRYGSSSPSWLYNYLLLAERYIGTDAAAPIVGLTGVDWFADGYLNGTYNQFGHEPLGYPLDGIDGWAAMKREILFCKAMGFRTVSVFHFDRYQPPEAPEWNGFFSYYGLERLEELATSWNASETIEYPISSLEPEFGRRGLFPPNSEFMYDVLLNPEMVLVQAIIMAVVFVLSMVKVKVGKVKESGSGNRDSRENKS